MAIIIHHLYLCKHFYSFIEINFFYSKTNSFKSSLIQNWTSEKIKTVLNIANCLKVTRLWATLLYIKHYWDNCSRLVLCYSKHSKPGSWTSKIIGTPGACWKCRPSSPTPAYWIRMYILTRSLTIWQDPPMLIKFEKQCFSTWCKTKWRLFLKKWEQAPP